MQNYTSPQIFKPPGLQPEDKRLMRNGEKCRAPFLGNYLRCSIKRCSGRERERKRKKKRKTGGREVGHRVRRYRAREHLENFSSHSTISVPPIIPIFQQWIVNFKDCTERYWGRDKTAPKLVPDFIYRRRAGEVG